MELIENLDRFSYLNDTQRKSIEQKEQAFLWYSNISFKVMKVDEHEAIIQTSQLKPFSENYADENKLLEITESVFSIMLYGRKLRVVARPYFVAPADVVTTDWIKEQMAKQKTKLVDLEKLLGIDKSTISQYLSGKRELSRGVKSMFFYFYAYQEAVSKI